MKAEIKKLHDTLLNMAFVKVNSTFSGGYNLSIKNMSSRYYHAKECYFIAIAIKVLLQDTDWLRYAGLWLTTLDNDFDDRLWIDKENNLFLNRRYEYDLSTEALRRSLQQQCTIAKHLQLNYDARSDDYHDTKHGTEHYIDEPRIFR